MGIVIENGILCSLDPIRVDSGALRIDGDRIVEHGGTVFPRTGDEALDCRGAVVLPGLVNGHTHLYSALATGMPTPPKTPRNFNEILKYVWWRLDQALDAESIEMSARIGALEAIRCGTTTLIDHHASPKHIDGSLDLIEKSLREIGPRGLLCYETTDRHGHDGRQRGLDENERFLDKCAGRNDGHFAALVGAHAAFTLEDDSLNALVALAKAFKAGLHIHVAEDPCDDDFCRWTFGHSLMERLSQAGLYARENILAHGTHLDAAAIQRINQVGLTMAHNSRSNMNNAVGYAPVEKFECPVMLGTDGIGADMFAEARAAWFISRHQHALLPPSRIVQMLAHSARRAGASLGVTLGQLEAGAAADIIVTDLIPSTPLDASNLAGHMLFSLDSRHVRDVMIAGRWVMRDRRVLTCEEPSIRATAQKVARELWRRMSSIPCE